MDKRLFLIFVIMGLFLGGCTTNNEQIPLAATSKFSDTVDTAAQLTTSTPLQATAFPTPTKDMYLPSVCAWPHQEFDVGEALNMSMISLRFESENLLAFEGWREGPDPVVTPITPEPTPELLPGPNIYTRRVLTAGEIDLREGEIRQRSLDWVPLLNNPCGEACPLEIIGQAPNQQWQLVQIHDWLVEKSGIWLVSEDQTVRLIPYMSDLQWQWATDSSLLWLVYSDPALGGHTLAVTLENPVVLRGTGPLAEGLPHFLDPWPYIVAFSPIDKVAMSTTSFEFPELDSDELVTVDLTDTFTMTDVAKVIPGLVTVKWNDGTENFLLEVVKEDSVEIKDLSGNTLVIVPRSSLQSFYSLPDDGPLSPYFRIGNYALSPSGTRLAVLQGTRLMLFVCDAVSSR